MSELATSPSASGPAGSLFEGQVGAHYLLTMLAGAEARGMPHATIESIRLQRAGEGYALDDVIVLGRDKRGRSSTLEIQVKRSVTFAPTDTVFTQVVEQMVKSASAPGFWTKVHEFAIAVAKTSRKIDGAYQEVLNRARQLSTAKEFVDQIGRAGAASNDMRTFVDTFRTNLAKAGSDNSDEVVYNYLRRIQILIFDFAATGSSAEELAKERAVRCLHSSESHKGAQLWTSLVMLALQIASNAGSRTRAVLISDLAEYRLAGEPSLQSARKKIVEDSRHALADISTSISGAVLSRPTRLEAVNAALDTGRYVEIRGDAGVGKSGVLKHVASLINVEGLAIVLAPDRIVPRGWGAWRDALGIDAEIEEFLSDLASDGGTIVFIDNLDRFSRDERVTVVDVVRGAANVPGLSILVTARRPLDTSEEDWLPTEAIDKLGHTEPVVINELDDSEVEELGQLAPKLAPLLRDDHPAKSISRNLFRLSRLLALADDDAQVKTEVNMVDVWWSTADGKQDAALLDRQRILHTLAQQALSDAEVLTVVGHPSEAIDSLVRSESLRSIGRDRVAFRHDILREWAISSLLYDDPATIEQLRMDRPATTILARAIELCARMHLDHEVNGARWHSFLSAVSGPATHPSWRRAALLAVVRSEDATTPLIRVSAFLLANGGALLRELIRVVMAVDVEPAKKHFVKAGFSAEDIPGNWYVPTKPSWYRLLILILHYGNDLPVEAVPDVVDLFRAWATGTLGQDSLTPRLVEVLYLWLMELKGYGEKEGMNSTFVGKLTHDELSRLIVDVRSGFLLFCDRVPHYAKTYLDMLLVQKPNDEEALTILKFRGSLAKAAPLELAELTYRVLVPTNNRAQPRPHRGRGFNFADAEFLPPSPAQGPFMDLLLASAEIGVSLIRRIVTHAAKFESGEGCFEIETPNGTYTFLDGSYYWSRDGYGAYAVTSALMALEAWGHHRIESGVPVEDVLSDVLGAPPTEIPAAYALIAVDLIISHWPKTRVAAVPFLACPKLLCLDNGRHHRDTFTFPDVLGLKGLERPEPKGVASIESLKRRASRKHSLDELLQFFVQNSTEQKRDLLKLLRRAARRLGKYSEHANYNDPAFMAKHAMEFLNLKNWEATTVEQKDGTRNQGLQYRMPRKIAQHLAKLEREAAGPRDSLAMRDAIGTVLDSPERGTEQFVASAIEWAVKAKSETQDSDDHDERMRQEAICSSALIAMRDGGVDLKRQRGKWAQEIFIKTLDSPIEDLGGGAFEPKGLRFCPLGIAFAGLAYSVTDAADQKTLHLLLVAAARNAYSSSRGFRAVAKYLADVDVRLPKSVLRCALSACIRPDREDDHSDEGMKRRRQERTKLAKDCANRELAWLTGAQPEPNWPKFPTPKIKPKSRWALEDGEWKHVGKRKRGSQPTQRVYHQAVARWINNAEPLLDVRAHPWIKEVAQAYSAWSEAINGGGLTQDEEIDERPYEWNRAYYNLLGQTTLCLTTSEIDQYVIKHLLSLPEKAFADAVESFLLSLDRLYFDGKGPSDEVAVGIRRRLAEKFKTSAALVRLTGHPSPSMERHIGSAVSVFFFNQSGISEPPKCYLLPRGIDKIDPFLPLLTELNERYPSFLVAVDTLNLLEVSPRLSHLELLLISVESWLATYPSSRIFWFDYGLGDRVCSILDTHLSNSGGEFAHGQPHRITTENVLARLVQMGIARANQLERMLRVLPSAATN